MTLFLEAVKNLCGGSYFKLEGDDAYENIVEWFVDTPPTKEQVVAEHARLLAEQPYKEAKAKRAAAYAVESNPLAFKYLRGEATIEEYTAKVAEIRNRYPYPEAEQ